MFSLRTFPISTHSVDFVTLRPFFDALDSLFFGPTSPVPDFDPPLAAKARLSISQKLTSLHSVFSNLSPSLSILPPLPYPGNFSVPFFPDTPSQSSISKVDFPHFDSALSNLHLNPRRPPRGAATLIDVSRISLPDPTRKPMSAAKLLDLLPTRIRHAVHDEAQSFLDPIVSALSSDNSHKNNQSTFRHTISQRPGHFPQVLAKCHDANMLSWTKVADEPTTVRFLRDRITLSSFAVVKNASQDRLISWPKAQNALGPPPLDPALPTPDAWTRIHTSAASLLGFKFDVRNMFHHLPLPPRLSKLFPLHAYRLHDLPSSLQSKLQLLFSDSLSPNDRLRPYHATTPMGWSWAVTLANAVAYSLLTLSRTLYRPPPYAGVFARLDGQYHALQDGDAILDAYIDDSMAICLGWQPQHVSEFYNRTVQVFTNHGLPWHSEKSLPLDKIEDSTLEFTGWIWHLRHHIITPNPHRVTRLQLDIHNIDPMNVTVRELLSITGKLIWFSLALRPLLAILDKIFRHNETKVLDDRAFPTERELNELCRLSQLLPLAAFNLRTPWSSTIVATDASESGYAVVYTTVQPSLAQRLYTLFLRAVPHGNQPPPQNNSKSLDYLSLLTNTVQNNSWKTAFRHKWQRVEHISSLEASAIASSPQWLASRQLCNVNTLILTDSASSLGAYAKGRSSVRALLARCRKVAAITIAHCLVPRFCFVPTTVNPADGPSRFDC